MQCESLTVFGFSKRDVYVFLYPHPRRSLDSVCWHFLLTPRHWWLKWGRADVRRHERVPKIRRHFGTVCCVHSDSSGCLHR